MITTDLNRAEFDGDASETVFVFRSGGTDIPVKDISHIKVYVGAVLKTITTHYTVSLTGSTATITFTSGNTPPSGTKNVLFIRDVPFKQETDLQNNSQLEAESLENQLDLIVNQSQQINNKVARNLRFSDTLVTTDATDTHSTLNVTASARANKALKFDSSGNLSVSTLDVDKVEDSVNDAKSYATEAGANVNTYDGGSASATSDYSAKEWAVGTSTTSAKDYATKTSGAVTGTDYSAKAWSVGGTGVTDTASRGAAKEWAIETSGNVDGTSYSAKEYAQGTQASTGGSAKSWSQDTDQVNGAGTNDRSAKSWSQGASMTGSTLGGSSKDWASLPVSTGTVDGTLYSSKAYSQSTTAGTSTYGGSAKGWASTAHGAAVPGAGGSDRSALHYATDASNSATAAKNSAAAVSNTFDKFDDTYLGKMADNPSFTADASTEFITSNAHGLVNTQIIRLTGSDLPAGLSASTNYYVREKTTNTFKLETSVGNGAINITDAGSGTMTWYHGDVTTPTSSSWAKNSSTITVASNIGIRVGQVVSGSGIPTSPKPNVVSIDGTSIVISENMTAAGSSVAVTFASRGVYGQYNTTTKGPTTNNDGDALETGSLFFSSTSNEMRILDSGGNWIAATSAGDVSLLEYKFVTTSAQVTSKTYSGAADVGGTLSYTQDNIIVFMNGIQLKNGVDYTASNGTSIVLTNSASLSDEIAVIAFKSFTTADMVSKSNGGTFASAVTFGAGLTSTTEITANGGLQTDTNSIIKDKGRFMQHSTHQSWVLGG